MRGWRYSKGDSDSFDARSRPVGRDQELVVRKQFSGAAKTLPVVEEHFEAQCFSNGKQDRWRTARTFRQDHSLASNPSSNAHGLPACYFARPR
jgi:hypothetical protein